MVKKLTDYKVNLFFIIAAIAIVSLPFFRLGNLVCSLLLSALFLKKIFLNKKSLIVFIFIPFLLYISFILASRAIFISNIKYIEKFWLLGCVPLGFYFFNQREKRQLKLLFSASVFFTQIYSLIHIFIYFNTTTKLFSGLKNFSYINLALGVERPYIGFMSAIAILFLLFTKSVKGKYLKIRIGLILFGITYIIFIAAKLALFLTIIILIVYFLKKSNIKHIIGVLGAFIVISIFFKLSILERIQSIKNDDRIYLWSNAKELVKDDFSIWTGTHNKGFLENKNLFTIINVEKAPNEDYMGYYARLKKNVHNQYLSLYINGGIILLLLFLAPFLFFFLRELKSKNKINILLIVSFMLFLSVENVLDRQSGVMLIAIFLGLTLPAPDFKKVKNLTSQEKIQE